MKTLLLGFTLILGACSLGKQSSDQNTALIRQNKEVNDLYGPLVGTYAGKLRNTDHGDEDVQLIIYLSNEAVTNPDGTPGSKDVPLAYFRRDNPVIGDYAMDVSGYKREEGNLGLRNLGTEPIVRSVRAHVAGGAITGPVLNSTGTLGILDLHFVSSDTSARNDAKDRLLRRYQAVSGVYVGTIPNKDPRKVRHLSIELTATYTGDQPKLDGFYRNLDVKGGEVDLPLTVSYRPEMSPAQITCNGRGGAKYALNMNGVIIDDVMTVDIDSPFFQGFLGTATLKRRR